MPGLLLLLVVGQNIISLQVVSSQKAIHRDIYITRTAHKVALILKWKPTVKSTYTQRVEQCQLMIGGMEVLCFLQTSGDEHVL